MVGNLLMGYVIWVGVLPSCLIALWLVLRRPVRQFTEDLHVERARELFRMQREGLEARFVSALTKLDPVEGIRWEEAHWHNEVLWARDCQSRSLLALIGVHFDTASFDELGEPHPKNATALFEYRKGRWYSEGKRLDELRPDEAVLRGHRFEPVIMQPRRGF
jgi:hypothetical protein